MAESRKTGDVSSQDDAPTFKLTRQVVVGLLAPACFFTWTNVSYLTEIIFGHGDYSDAVGTTVLIASLVGYLVAFAWRTFGPAFKTPFSTARVFVWAGAAIIGTLLIEWMRLMPDIPGSLAVVVVAAFVSGLGFALLLVYWIAQYARRDERLATYEVGLIFLIEAALTTLILALPAPADFTLVSLLPLAAALSVDWTQHHDTRADHEQRTIEPMAGKSFKLPGSFVFGVVVIGLVYGMTQDFAMVYRPLADSISMACGAASVIVGVFLLVFAKKTGRNFGSSAQCLIIVPLAGLAQGMVATLRTDWLVASLLVMRVAYELFNAMIVLQLPRVFNRVGTIRLYLFVRILFEGALLAGIVCHKVLMLSGFVYFDVVAIFNLGLLLVALTLAFERDNVGNVWNLMPTKVPHTGKFRRACHRIERGYGLTNRESEILELVLRGRSGPYIQDYLVISKNTYQTHMRNLYGKIDVHSQQSLLDLLEEYMDENRGSEP